MKISDIHNLSPVSEHSFKPRKMYRYTEIKFKLLKNELVVNLWILTVYLIEIFGYKIYEILKC